MTLPSLYKSDFANTYDSRIWLFQQWNLIIKFWRVTKNNVKRL